MTLRGAAIPITLTKNQVKIISVHFINKKSYVPLKLSTNCPQESNYKKIMLIKNISHAC